MGIFTNKSNERMNAATNAANIQIAQETNAANMAINQANIDYSREAWDKEVANQWRMWEETNKYNSAASQRARLEEAGLNPYLMLNGGDAGSASSSSTPSHSQPQQIPMQGVTMQPYYSDNYLGLEFIAGLSDILQKVEGLKSMRIDNAYRDEMNRINIAKAASEIGKNKSITKGQDISNFINQSTAGYTIEAAKKQPQFIDAQINSLMLNNKLAEAKLPFVSQTAQAELDNLVVQKLISEKKLSYIDKLSEAQLATMYAEAALKNKQRLNLPTLTAEQSRKLGQLLVDQAQADLTGQRYENMFMYRDWQGLPKNVTWNKFTSGLGSLTGAIGNILGGSVSFSFSKKK